MSIRIRVRIHLPPADLAGALALSALGHAAIATAVLVGGTRLGLPEPSRPVMTVRLVAGSPAAEPQPRTAPPVVKTARPSPAPEKPKPTPRPKRKPSPRHEVDQPRVVESPRKAGASARPERLPVHEPEPAPEEASHVEGAESKAAPGEETEPAGPIAGGVAGLETDQPFTADWYLQLVVARLQDAWRDRPLLPWGAAPQRVVVGFTIERDGRVVDARIIRPSSYSPLDLSALRAVRSVGRLPPLPTGYGSDHLGARFVFELLPPGAPR